MWFMSNSLNSALTTENAADSLSKTTFLIAKWQVIYFKYRIVFELINFARI